MIRERLKAGWTEEQAMTLGKTPPGYRPVNGAFRKSQMRPVDRSPTFENAREAAAAIEALMAEVDGENRFSVWANNPRTVALMARDKAQRERIARLEGVLIEARRWIGDGECGDGLHRDYWTVEYKHAVDLVDAALEEKL